MLNTLNDVLNNVDNFIWGMPLIILILFTGILLTVRLRGLQVRHLGKALHYVFHNEDDGEGEVTSFGALCDRRRHPGVEPADDQRLHPLSRQPPLDEPWLSRIVSML